MNNAKAILGAALIISAGFVLSAVIRKPCIHSCRRPTEVQGQPAESPAADRDRYMAQFKQQVQAKTPALELPDAAITSVEVLGITRSADGSTISIHPRIQWQRGPETEFKCLLKADGFGGYVGQYSPISDNRKEISIEIR